MASPALSFPFAHWDFQTSVPDRRASVSTSRIFTHHHQHLVAGLSTGEILVFSLPHSANERVSLRGRLTGHKAPIIALSSYTTVSENSFSETLLLSLSSDGSLSKWSLHDHRCLQAVSAITSARAPPRGMVVAENSGIGECRLTDSFVLVYGCNTEIVVLNAESLETVLLWTGNVDWPLPVVLDRTVEDNDKERTVVTITPAGQVAAWVLAGNRSGLDTTVLSVTAREDVKADLGREGKWGKVKALERTGEGYVVAYARGVAFYGLRRSPEFALLLRNEFHVEDGVLGVVVIGKGLEVCVHCSQGVVRVFRIEDGQMREVGAVQPSAPYSEHSRVVSVASDLTASDQEAKVVFFTERRSPGDGDARTSILVGRFHVTEQQIENLQWSEKALASAVEAGEEDDQPSSCSAVFSHMLCVAHGCTLRFYSIPAFLLSYREPTNAVDIPCGGSRICLLKCVRVGDYISSVSSNGSRTPKPGKEYLIVGTVSGDIFIIEAPSFQPSERLALFPSAAVSAHLLPGNLGRRLRSTLFVSSADGTSAVVDVERARIMVTFPSHDYSPLSSFATIQGRNLVALTYEDGVRREWDMGEEDGGVLRNPPPSRGSTDITNSNSNNNTSGYGSEEGDWGVVVLRPSPRDEHREFGLGEEENGAIVDCEELCRTGLPSAAVNVRVVLEALEMATATAQKRTRESERRVVANNPTLLNARALLTALIPGGLRELLRQDDAEAEASEEQEEEDQPWKSAVESCFFKRKTPAVLGQIGAGRRITMLTPSVVRGGDVSPTVTGIVLLSALILITDILDAVGKRALVNVVLEKVLQANIGRQEEEMVALGVFAKFWSDGHLVIRWAAREALDAFMSGLSPRERDELVEYWESYLPVHVPPELFSTKEVVRSIMVLGKLITDYNRGNEEGLEKSVALSAELLLSSDDELYQDTAIEVIGYSWSKFQSYFDPYEVIHNLIRIYARPASAFPPSRRQTLHRCILEIAEKNAPLLVTALANNISHGSPSSTPTASLTMATLQSLANVSVAAMRLVAMVVREDAVLLRDVLGLVVDAVVKILDPNGGLRDRVLPVVTELVNGVVEAYPTVTFHRPTQRLALSASAGIIVIHDLKSSSTAHVLEGHHHLATSLTFSHDGRYLAAVDADENTLFVWRFPSGLMSFIGSATESGREKPLLPKGTFAFANQRGVGMVGVEWTQERTVVVKAGTEVSTFSV